MAQFVALAIVAFPHAAVALALVVLGLASAWYGVVRRGAVHVLALISGALLLAMFLVLMIADRPGLVLGRWSRSGSA
jgi:hypothetical protein